MNIALVIAIILNSIAVLLCLRGIFVNIYINKNNVDVIIYLILLFMNGLVGSLNLIRLFGKL